MIILIIMAFGFIAIICFLVNNAINQYMKEKEEQDYRINKLEQRLEKYNKDRDDELVNIYDNISINNHDIDMLKKELKIHDKKKKDNR